MRLSVRPTPPPLWQGFIAAAALIGVETAAVVVQKSCVVGPGKRDRSRTAPAAEAGPIHGALVISEMTER